MNPPSGSPPPDATAVVPIGHVRSVFSDLAAAPRQATERPGLTGQVVVRDDLTEGLLGLDRYPFLWLVTWLHVQAGPSARPLTLVPSGTGTGAEPQGVFASRSPNRPNPIGLSLVRSLGTSGSIVSFEGVDLLDGTPVLDIKPWFADCDLPRSGAG